MDVDGCGWPVAPQYGDSVATSLKNVQNFPKTSNLRENSVKIENLLKIYVSEVYLRRIGGYLDDEWMIDG